MEYNSTHKFYALSKKNGFPIDLICTTQYCIRETLGSLYTELVRNWYSLSFQNSSKFDNDNLIFLLSSGAWTTTSIA